MLYDITKIWILSFRRTSAYNTKIPDTALIELCRGFFF